MNIIITAGADFISSSVIRHIINNIKNSEVNLDNLTGAGNLKSLSEVRYNNRYTFEQVDIYNDAELDPVLKTASTSCNHALSG